MNKKVLWIALAIFSVVVTVSFCFQKIKSSSAGLPESVSYNYHIRPVLSDKCFACHGPDAGKREAGLRLDIADSAFAPLRETKGAFAIVPGKPEQSELLKRISSTDSSYIMPTPESHLGALTGYEIKLFKKWIQQGAKYESHWAFTIPKKAPLPKVSDRKWVKNEIDYFVLSKIAEKGLHANEEADKERLLKRICLDITGLPPSMEMMDKFSADNSEDAYEKMIDNLLATPQYGEKMAVHWMDVARYADSYGYQDDNIRTQWPWRDWVIHAFNKNMPYDQFLTWQIAGDMLPNANKEQILATAFFRNHKYTEEGGVIPEEYRIEYLVDKTKTFGKGILGITIECAQCHDHKYDPFSQKDYYSLLAFFNNTKEAGYEGEISTSKPAKNPILYISNEDRKNVLAFINSKDTGSLMMSVMGERDTLRKTFLLNRGVYDQPGEEVRPAAIPAVMKFDTSKFARNRIGLAQWTVNKNNPLTARVFVNLMWQELFGRGLVKTSGDFGMQGELPSHPELLDWLAVDFMEHGWNVKRLVKQILMSATYRQSAKVSEQHLKMDPENIYLSRGPRMRLKAEFVRDLYLSSSGLLVKTIGGPSVKPYQPSGLWEAATSGRGALTVYKQDHGDDLYRRGLYTFIKLTVPPPGMIMFDASNRDQCEVKRQKTNTPIQALVMMNDPSVLEASRVLAQKLVSEQSGINEKISRAFRLIVCRKPSETEMNILQDYYTQQLQLFGRKGLDAATILKIGEYPLNDKVGKNTSAALMKVISMIYNMEETITKS
ncbi:PSD1 and planctomycete cytochrome C domain-containing protein [Chitinophagaceae bacterium LB-8]|uniref:PSD1 and planctomycete cytochrome C domain-containing protein n=1 Tax=Paraflavisolibacter caeni TaxID=2982496 RepID=A0A9X3BHD5_9BACT|nr:PSD1 and planctomycete cytochrome C domain-containing protein [Paraflavisolibacter caeni]MCU7552204.1 PSD1 and planctomycete cytochrome C domain-containing protein [Paraflavisolibacter caeni]